jgi:hypothetical protein
MKITTSLLIAALILAGCGTAPVVDPDPIVAPSRSVEQANANIVAAAAEEERIEDRYYAEQVVCYKRFFVNNCLDAAKEERRLGLAGTTARDNEAQHYLRQNALDVRDAEIAKNEKDAAEREAKLALEPPRAPKVVTPAPPPKPRTVPDRKARQAARERDDAAKTQAEAGKRAANVAEAAQRREDAVQRQNDAAKRKADRAADQAKRAADKAKADADAAAAAAAAAAKK